MKNEKLKNMGTTLIDIFNFVDDNKKYKIKTLLLGKRGLIYAVILLRGENRIYVPCIYSEFLGSEYETDKVFPDLKDFKRTYLYEYVDDYNCI